MKITRSIVCFLIVLALFWLMFYLRNPKMLLRCYNLGYLLVIVGGTIALGFISFSPAEIGKALTIGWSRRECSQDEYRKYFLVLRALSRNAISLGFIAFGIFFFLTLSDPDPKMISPNLSRAVLPLIYGVFLSEIILRPIANQILRKITNPVVLQESRRDKWEIILITVVLFLAVLTVFLALIGAFSIA